MKTETFIVDDDPVICLIHRKLLSASAFGPETKVFNDGLAAANFLREHFDSETKYFIFLDLNMPVMDGFEFLTEIKDQYPPENIRVSIVTSSIFGEDREKAKQFPHVTGFIEKPLSTAKLQQLQQPGTEN
ncbi:MAG TPA: response regulator [Sphingobacteriaceae bacterium]